MFQKHVLLTPSNQLCLVQTRIQQFLESFQIYFTFWTSQITPHTHPAVQCSRALKLSAKYWNLLKLPESISAVLLFSVDTFWHDLKPLETFSNLLNHLPQTRLQFWVMPSLFESFQHFLKPMKYPQTSILHETTIICHRTSIKIGCGNYFGVTNIWKVSRGIRSETCITLNCCTI